MPSACDSISEGGGRCALIPAPSRGQERTSEPGGEGGKCQSTSSASLSPFLLHRGDGPGQVDLSCRHCGDSHLRPAGRRAYPGTDYGAFLDLFTPPPPFWFRSRSCRLRGLLEGLVDSLPACELKSLFCYNPAFLFFVCRNLCRKLYGQDHL